MIKSWRKAGLGLVAIILLSLVVLTINNRQQQQIDLLQDYDWSLFAGTEKSDNGLIIQPLKRKIVNQDGTGGQPNPPVNLAGPVLSYKGDFSLEAEVKNFDNGDSLQIYGGVPIVYDEWRFESPSLKFSVVGNKLIVEKWNGQSSTRISVQEFNLAQPLKDIKFERINNGLYIINNLENSNEIGHVQAEEIFSNGKLWFGATAADGWTLESLQAQSSDNIQAQNGLSNAKKDDPNSLQNLTNKQSRPIKIGAAVALNPLLTDQKYRDLALSQFGIWTTENELKAQFVQPEPGKFSFKEADLLVQTALDNGISVHGHALVFGEANPRWMQAAQPADRQQIMTEHISKVVSHYKDKITEWDVINEPLSDEDEDYVSGDGLRRHLWYQAMGKDYIATALRIAHQSDPKAKLYINDYGLEADGERWDALIKLVKELKAQNVPLNGIGFESHIYETGDHVDPEVLSRHIEELRQLGLESRISEIDVHGENAQIQAQQYEAVLKACLKSPGCNAFSSWGITDRYGSTTEINHYPLSYGNDLLWDKNYHPKLALNRLRGVLK